MLFFQDSLEKQLIEPNVLLVDLCKIEVRKISYPKNQMILNVHFTNLSDYFLGCSSTSLSYVVFTYISRTAWPFTTC